MAKSFSEMIGALRGGDAQREIDEALTDAVLAVQDTSKSATLTLTVTISPMGGGKVKIEDKVSSKKPSLDKGFSIFFIEDGGSLSRRNPNQMSMQELER